ncbi:unnamed protein product [Rhizophagus irregularis]|nr:unnamed protein product [Rhizophagus irregularis]
MNKIPTRGLPSIMEEYFLGLDTVLKEYLISQIFQKQRDQIAQSLCYDIIMIDIAREDNYDQPQSLLSSLLGNIIQHNVQEIWKASRYHGQQTAP